MLLSLARVTKFAFHNFWRNFWLSVVTVSIITLSFLSVNFFVFSSALVDTSLAAIEDKVNVSVYFKSDAPEEAIFAMRGNIQQLPEVVSVEYISKDRALELMTAEHEKRADGLIIDSLKELDSNPLFASLVIKARDLDSYPVVLNALNTDQYSSIIQQKNFDDRRELIKKIDIVKTRIKEIGLVITLFFFVITALIVFNTIRITIYTRREEIGIMKLVGASNWFVRAPLILESMLYSVIAITLTIMILYPILGVVQPYADSIFAGQAFDVLGYFSDNFFMIFGYELLASLLLNVLSAWLAMSRYLRV